MAIIDDINVSLGFQYTGQAEFNLFAKQVEKAESKLDSLKKGVKEFADASTKYVSKSAGTITGFANLIGKAIVSTNAEFENFQRSLEGIGESSEDASLALDKILEFSNEAPILAEDLAKAFILLKQEGIDPMADDMLTVLGDAAVGGEKSIESVAGAFSDAMKGNFKGLKELDIENSRAADKIVFTWRRGGKTLVQQAENDGESIRRALLKLLGQSYGGAMKGSADSWDGMLIRLQNHWTSFRKKVGENGAFDRIKSALDNILFFIDKFAADGRLDQWAKMVSDAIVWVVDELEWLVFQIGYLIGDMLEDPEKAKSFFKELAVAIGILFAIARPVVKWLVALGLAVHDLISYINGAPSLIGTFVDKIKEVLGVSDSVAEGILAVIAVLGLLLFKFPGLVFSILGGLFRIGAKALFYVAKKAFLKLLARLGVWLIRKVLDLNRLRGAIKAFFKSLGDRIAAGAKEAFKKGKKYLGKLFSKELWKGVWEALKRQGSKIKEAFRRIVPKGTWKRIVDGIRAGGARVWQVLKSSLLRLGSGVAKWGARIGGWLLRIGVWIVRGIAGSLVGLNRLGKLMGAFFKSIGSKIAKGAKFAFLKAKKAFSRLFSKNLWKGVWESLKRQGGKIKGLFRKIFSKGTWAKVIGWARTGGTLLWTALRSFFSKLGPKLIQWGPRIGALLLRIGPWLLRGLIAALGFLSPPGWVAIIIGIVLLLVTIFWDQLVAGWNYLKEKIPELWDKLFAWFQEEMPKLQEKMVGLFQKITEWFGEIDWLQVGDSIMNGIFEGMKAVGTTIKEWIDNLANLWGNLFGEGTVGGNLIELHRKGVAELKDKAKGGFDWGKEKLKNGYSAIREKISGSDIIGAASNALSVGGSMAGLAPITNTYYSPVSNVVTVNQTVKQIAEAPLAAAHATGQSVQGAATNAARAQVEMEPSASLQRPIE